MTRFKHLVVIGASIGGIEALRTIVAGLPPDFRAPICVVVHTAPDAPGTILGEILTRAGALPAANGVNGERLQPGHIYVAPPDFHLVVEPGRVRIAKGPRENRFRPAVDPLFRSAAQVYGPAAIGVVLTGALDDGTDGLWAIKQLGGCAIVQDPAEALDPSMPQSAIAHVDVDYVLPLAQIVTTLIELTAAPVEAARPQPVPDLLQTEVKIAMEDNPLDAGLARLGEVSQFACPECHGVLFQFQQGGRVKFRCHTGHAYSVTALLAAIGAAIEDALWNAVRAIDEGQRLVNEMAAHLHDPHEPGRSDELNARVRELKRQAEIVRQLAMDRGAVPADKTS